jgi:hypothetical protein
MSTDICFNEGSGAQVLYYDEVVNFDSMVAEIRAKLKADYSPTIEARGDGNIQVRPLWDDLSTAGVSEQEISTFFDGYFCEIFGTRSM